MSKRFVMNNAKIQRNKALSTVALILILALAAFMTSLRGVNATENVPTYAFLAVVPNPTGVGQTVQVSFWIDKVPPTASTAFGDRWENMKVTITKPDGTTQTLGPFRSDDVGAAFAVYAPTTLGTYYFQMSFPGQHITGMSLFGTPVDETYAASTSPKVALTVQQEQIQPWPAAPLPTGYWQRPIEAENREWKPIAGDWLMPGYDGTNNRYNPYSAGPNSAHIVWTMPLAFGGIVGGNYSDFNYYTGLTYEGKFGSFGGGGPVIMYGNLYFNLPLSDVSGAGGLVCINLRTGQQLWWQNYTDLLQFGQEFDYQSPNQYGIIPYLWTTGPTYNAYDPFTGNWLFSLVNASTGTTLYGPNGELLVYILDGFSNQMTLWNSTKAIMYYQQPGVLPGGNVWQWRPLMQRIMDWTNGIQWKVSEPAVGGVLSMGAFGGAVSNDVLVAASGSFVAPQNWEMEVGYSTKDGHQLWVQNRTLPTGSTTWALFGPAGDGVYTEFHESTVQWFGFDIYTGQQIWGPTDPYPNAFGMYSWQASLAYGKLLAMDFGGYLHAYDIKTGKKVWDFFSGNSGLETAYGAWPINNPPPVSADGKIYITAGHGYNPPLFRGAQMYCLNATDGKLLWNVLGFYTYDPIALADGYLVAYNCYDAQIYCYGPGRTATTVSAPDTAVPLGTQVVIKGTVTDQSPGQTCLGIPAAGTPAISDASMSQWMEYLYMQKPKPTNATGVPVTLTALDSNGNTQNIGTVTSDAKGNFATAWTPPVPGLYKITATFAGSNSYFSSDAETSMVISNAPAAQAPISTPTPAATPPPPTVTPTPSPQVPETPIPPPSSAGVPTTYIIIAVVAIIIVVAAAALALRRRK